MPRTRRGPRARDASATRGMLLDAATAVFAEHGFAGARVDEIADRAGVNKALIYAYFGDKEGLYRAVLSSRFAAPAAAPAAAADADPREALEELVRKFFRLLVDDRAFARLVAWDLLSAGRGGRDVLVDSAGPTLERVVELVRRARAAGALPAGPPPELIRTAIIALCVGYSLQHPAMEANRARTGVSFGDDAFVDYACRLLFDGDGSGPPRTGAGRRGARR